MNTFQSTAIILLIGLLLWILRNLRRGKTPPLTAFAWMGLTVLAMFTILNPETTVTLAAILGIGRGSDLVFYIAIVGGFVGFYACYIQFRRLESKLTILIRQLALQEEKLSSAVAELQSKQG